MAVCDVATAPTFALNNAVVAPAETEMLGGTATALLLLPTLTFRPADGAGALSVTVHEVVPAPVNVLALHESELMAGATVELVAGNSAIEAVCEVFPCAAVMMAV